MFFSCGALLVVTRVDFLFAKATQGTTKTAKDGAKKDVKFTETHNRR